MQRREPLRVPTTALFSVALGVALLAGCSGEQSVDDPVVPVRPTTTRRATAPIFDELDLRLEFSQSEVEQGGVLRATFIIENRSGHEIVDSDCLLSAWRYGLIPSDEPSAALWQQVTIRCAQFISMPNGYSVTRGPVEFRARTRTGEPLPTGDYLAAFEVPGRSGRLTYPVKIT
jgi:hypothetical protein